MAEKRRLPITPISFSGLWSFVLHEIFTPLMTPKCTKKKKKITRLFLSSLNSFYYFIFWFKGLSFKTEFKNWVLTSGKRRSVSAWINPCSAFFLTQSDWLEKQVNQLLCVRKEALGTSLMPTNTMVRRCVIANA